MNISAVKPGNAIVRQAKNAMLSDLMATANKKNIRKSTLINASFVAANATFTAVHANGAKTGWAIFGGAFTALSSFMTGVGIKDYIKVSKTQKQTSQAVKDIFNNKDFMDVVNRYRRINGKKEMTSEQVMKAYKKVQK